VTVVYSPRYRGDRRGWVSERGTRYSTPEVVQTFGPVPVFPEPAVVKGGETVRYEGSNVELHGTLWTVWGEPRHPGLLRLKNTAGQVMRKVRPTSVVVIDTTSSD
jgi:hypothetical protein